MKLEEILEGKRAIETVGDMKSSRLAKASKALKNVEKKYGGGKVTDEAKKRVSDEQKRRHGRSS